MVATGVFFVDFEYVYLSQALFLDPLIVVKVPAPKLIGAATLHLRYLYAYLILLWTATFAVKFSFLAFFRQLVRSVERIQVYYWVVVGFTALTWMFVVAQPFILCHHFGAESSKKETLLRSRLGHAKTL